MASLRMIDWKRLSWPHPEWWTIALSVTAWLVLLAQAMIGGVSQTHAGHSHHSTQQSLPVLGPIASPTGAFSWLLMIAAMMFPMILESVRIIAARSLWPRRHKAIVEFLVGYVAIWALFGIVASIALSILQSQMKLQTSPLIAVAFGAAVLWQLAPAKRRALVACHRTIPIAPTGWRADRDCFRSGWIVGTSCAISCWALMFSCMVAGHSIPAMFCATAVGWTERTRRRPNQRLLCSILVLLAVAHVIAPYLMHSH